MKCDVFISYRRDGGDMTAMHIYQALKDRGYDVFYDLEVLKAGRFNEALLEAIDSCTDFVLILSPRALDRCREEGDWVRREIAEALKQKKNIVPVMLHGFTFPETLPEDIEEVRFQNGLTATTEYFSESIDRLCSRYMNSTPAARKAGKGGGGKGGIPPKAWGIAMAALLLVLGAVLYFSGVFNKKDPDIKVDTTAAPAAAVTAGLSPEEKEEPKAAEETMDAAAPEATEQPAATAELTAAAATEATEAPTAAAAPETTAEPAATAEPTAAPSPEAEAAAVDYEAMARMELPVLMEEQSEDVLAENLGSYSVLGGPWKREQIHAIEFTDREPGAEAWDVSASGDGSVRAWVETDAEENTLFISAGGPVRLPENSSFEFAGYTEAKTLRLNGLVDFSRVRYAINAFSFSGYRELDFSGIPFRDLEAANGLFQADGSLISVNFEGASMGRLTSMECMFQFCQALEEVDLSWLDTSRVQSFTCLFDGCQSLRKLDLSGFDTGRAVRMNSMFDSCVRLEELKLGKMDTSRVITMEHMFSGCNALRELDVSSFDTGRVRNMEAMFCECNSLMTLDVSGFDTGRVENLSHMFERCLLMDQLDLSRWNTSACKAMNFMFNGCESLISLDVSSFDTSAVENLSHMFERCLLMDQLDLSRWNTSACKAMNFMFNGCESLISLDVSSFDTSAVEDMSNMFCGMNLLESLDVSGLKTGRVRNFEGMFRGCSLLEKLDVSGFDLSSAENMSGMFENCEELESIGTDPASFGRGNTENMFAMTPLAPGQ